VDNYQSINQCYTCTTTCCPSSAGDGDARMDAELEATKKSPGFQSLHMRLCVVPVVDGPPSARCGCSHAAPVGDPVSSLAVCCSWQVWSSGHTQVLWRQLPHSAAVAYTCTAKGLAARRPAAKSLCDCAQMKRSGYSTPLLHWVRALSDHASGA
jgi:hypothetical protein